MSYDEDDHHKEVYAHAGLVLYKAQCFEVEVYNFLLLYHLSTNRTITAEEYDAFINRAERKTLGSMLREMRHVVTADDEFQNLLVDALGKRNWFIHAYFRDRISGFMSADGRDELIQELQELASLFERADKAIQVFTNSVGAAIGMTDEVLWSITSEMFGENMANWLIGRNKAS